MVYSPRLGFALLEEAGDRTYLSTTVRWKEQTAHCHLLGVMLPLVFVLDSQPIGTANAPGLEPEDENQKDGEDGFEGE